MRPSLLAAVGLLALAGCAGAPAGRGAPSQSTPAYEAVQAQQLNSLLAALSRVVSGTPAEQAELVAEARARYEDSRGGLPALRYGLLLSAPGHAGRAPELAQQALREALAQPGLLSVNERAMGIVELERVTAELRADAENQRLTAELQMERERQRNGVANAQSARALQAANEQIAQLRRDLKEARDKLDAIAALERRQADRPPPPETRNP